jgi:hypothetical protein
MSLNRGAAAAATLCFAAMAALLLVSHRPAVLDEAKALALADGTGTLKQYSTLSAGQRGMERRALKLAEGHGRQHRFSALSTLGQQDDQNALKLAEGHLTPDEREAIAEGKVRDQARWKRIAAEEGNSAPFQDPSGGPGKNANDIADLEHADPSHPARTSENQAKALALAEGIESPADKAAIADGGTGDSNDRLVDDPAVASTAADGTADYSMAADDIPTGALADLPLQPAQPKMARALHAAHKARAALHGKKAQLLAGEAAAARRAHAQHADARRVRRALHGADALTRGAEEGLEDVPVPAGEVRRGWAGF